MVASSDQNDNGAADQSAELGRLAAEMLLKSPFLAMNPTLVPPTAALAAATIVGFGLSTQMAGAFFGALQGALEVANRFAAEQEDAAAAETSRTKGAASNAAPQQPDGAGAATQQTSGAAPVGKAKPMDGKLSIVKSVSTVAPAAAAKPKRVAKKAVKTDDLKRISGVGPKLEQLLNGLGIRSMAQIAGWADDEVQRIDAALGVDGRIARDDWVGQAKKLAAKAAA